MGIEVYLLPPDSDEFKKNLLGRVLSGSQSMRLADYSGILYLAPTGHLVENFKKNFHTKIIEINGGLPYIPPQSMTLRQFSKMLCASYRDKAVISDAARAIIVSGLLDRETGGIGLSKAISGFIGELKLNLLPPDAPGRPLETPDTVKEKLASAFNEAGVPEEVSKRAFEAVEILKEYNETLGLHNAIDGDDALTVAASLVKSPSCPPFPKSPPCPPFLKGDEGGLSPTKEGSYDFLFLDGFYEVAPAEGLLLEAVIGNAEETFITIPVSSPEDDLTYCWSNGLKERFGVEAHFSPSPTPSQLTSPLPSGEGGGEGVFTYFPSPSMEEELEAIARHIKSSFISGRRRDLEDVYIVFPALAKYREKAERVLKRYGIPYHIDPPRTLSQKRPYLDLLAMIESVAEGYPRLPFARFLASPYFDIDPALREKVPGVSLTAGIVKGKGAWIKALRGVEKVFRKLEPLEIDNGSFKNYRDALYRVMKGFGFASGADSEVEDLFRSLKHLDVFISGETTLRGFIDALKEILDSTFCKPDKPDKCGVTVSNFFDMRGLEPGFLYMAGLKDGDMPSRPEMDLFLPDGIKKKLGLGDMKKHLLLQEHIFTRLAASVVNQKATANASAKGLRASYPTMEGDKFFLPSPFLTGWQEKKERLFGVFSKEEEMRRGGHGILYGDSHRPLTGEIKGIKKYGDSAISVTDIGSYRACPRKFFIEKVLGLTPPEVKEYEVEPETIGTIAHKVMEKIVHLYDDDMGMFIEAAVGPIAEVIEGADSAKSGVTDPIKTVTDPYFKALLRESFIKLLPEIHAIEKAIRGEGFTSSRTELRVEGEPLKGIKIKGKIDRVISQPVNFDTHAAGLAGDSVPCLVVDYKTGAMNFSGAGALKKGEGLQLFLYAAMLKSMGMRPLKAGVYSLKDLKVKWLPGKRDGNSMDDYIASSLGFLDETVGGMREGDFRARPLDEQTCGWCHERPYCPYIHGSYINGKYR